MTVNTPTNHLDWLDDALEDLQSRSLRRSLRTYSGPQAAEVTLAGERLINFGSNDYLGLAADPRLAEAARQATAEAGWGAGHNEDLLLITETGFELLHTEEEPLIVI